MIKYKVLYCHRCKWNQSFSVGEDELVTCTKCGFEYKLRTIKEKQKVKHKIHVAPAGVKLEDYIGKFFLQMLDNDVYIKTSEVSKNHVKCFNLSRFAIVTLALDTKVIPIVQEDEFKFILIPGTMEDYNGKEADNNTE